MPPPGCGLRWLSLVGAAGEEAEGGEAEGGEAEGGEEEGGEGEGGEEEGGEGEGGEAECVLGGGAHGVRSEPWWVGPVWEQIGPRKRSRGGETGRSDKAEMLRSAVVVDGEDGDRGLEGSVGQERSQERLPSMASCFQGITDWRGHESSHL